MKLENRLALRSLGITVLLMIPVLLRHILTEYPCGSVQGEIPGFLYDYSLPRPLGEIVFDPYINDWNMYQARELSYFLDFLDARFILSCWVRGVYHLFSPVAFLLLAGTVFAQQFFGARLFPRFGRLPLALCSLVYVLLPFAGVGYFRSAKHVCALLVTLIVFLFMKLYHGKFLGGGREQVRILVLLALLTLFDRQGMFFTACFAVFCGFLCIGSALRLRVLRSLSGASSRLMKFTLLCLIPVVFSAVNYSLTAPLLIHYFNGYYPDFGYAGMSVPAEASGAAFFCKALYCGADFVFANIGHALTCVVPQSVSFPLGLLCTAGVLILLFRKEKENPAFLSLLFMLSAMTACATAMYIRHPPIVRSDVVYTGYFKTFAAALFPFCLLALRHIPRRIRTVYPLVLAAVLLIPFPSGEKTMPDTPSNARFARDLLEIVENPEIDPRTRPLPYHFRILAERIRILRTDRVPDYTSPGAW